MRGPRTRQVAAINTERERALAAGITLDGNLYHSDDRFLSELLGMVLGYQTGIMTGTQAIRTRDNRIVQLNAAQVVALAAAVGDHRKAVYAASWADKDGLVE